MASLPSLLLSGMLRCTHRIILYGAHKQLCVFGKCVGRVANARNSPQDASHEQRPLNDYVIVVLAGWRPLGRLLRRVPSHFPNTLIACGAKQLYSTSHTKPLAQACLATLCGQCSAHTPCLGPSGAHSEGPLHGAFPPHARPPPLSCAEATGYSANCGVVTV